MCESVPLPACAFRIGENESASLYQLPDFAHLARYVAYAQNWTAPYSLGHLYADAFLKLSRPWMPASGGPVDLIGAGAELDNLADALLHLPPKARAARLGLLGGIAAFVEIMLSRPDLLPGFVARLDGLTNERLSERALAICLHGTDPGAADLWQFDPPGQDTLPKAAEAQL